MLVISYSLLVIDHLADVMNSGSQQHNQMYWPIQIQSFTYLDMYKECRQLRKSISELVKTNFPIEEKCKLSDQIVRSSHRVTACIAEGYGRHYYQDNVRFCRMSRGSLTETLEHLITAYDENYISADIP